MPALVTASRPRHASPGGGEPEAAPGRSSPLSWSPHVTAAAPPATEQGNRDGGMDSRASGRDGADASREGGGDRGGGVVGCSPSSVERQPRPVGNKQAMPVQVSGWEQAKASLECRNSSSGGGGGGGVTAAVRQQGVPSPQSLADTVERKWPLSRRREVLGDHSTSTSSTSSASSSGGGGGATVLGNSSQGEEGRQGWRGTKQAASSSSSSRSSSSEERHSGCMPGGGWKARADGIGRSGERNRDGRVHGGGGEVRRAEISLAERGRVESLDSENEYERRRKPGIAHDKHQRWTPEAVVDSDHNTSESRRRSLTPRVFTYEDMPRNDSSDTRAPPGEQEGTGNGSAAKDECGAPDAGNGVGGSVGIGFGNGGGIDPSVPSKKTKKKRNSVARKGGGSTAAQQAADKSKCGPRRPKGASSPHTKARPPLPQPEQQLPLPPPQPALGVLPRENGGDRAERDTPVLALSTPVVSATVSGGDGGGVVRDQEDTDGATTDADADTGAARPAAAAAAVSPAVTAISKGVEGRGKRLPGSWRASPASTRKGSPRSGKGGRVGRALGSGVLTYVTHELQTLADDDEDEGVFNMSACAERGAAGAAGAARPSFSKRKKRPRPTVLGGSARALVWDEPCPTCRRESLAAETIKGGEGSANARRSSPCLGAKGEGTAGQGPLRPGQYVYLRTASCEDVRRSLTSEGEFAAPRSGGVFGSDLTSARIRVWRKGGGASASGGSNGGGGGSFAEADVVKFDPASGRHRLRFVEDGAVEDVRLKEPGGDGRGNRRGQPGLRWLQRCARPRARDVVRRNSSGLCEGPSGEVRGLVGDEHDPSVQRQENWRWAMSRWRWGLGERDGYSPGDAAAPGNSVCEDAGVPLAGDGMFPPIGRVLAVERRYLDTGAKVVAGHVSGSRGEGTRAAEIFLKIARLWYPQDTRGGMDPFVHGNAEVFEACRVVADTASPGGEAIDCDESDHNFSAIGSCGVPAAAVSAANPASQGSASTGRGSRRVSSRVAAVCRLDAEQPLASSLKLEPVILWVRACEARRLASVHPCLDGRMNPCAGKVVNDPFQPQAEFFLSHRYCVELDAYFPLESAKTPAAAASPASPQEAGTASHKTSDDGCNRHPSPRSTKARLLNRGVSDGMMDLPAKWHPLKKRISLDKATSGAGAGGGGSGGRESPVIGWDTAVRRGGWAEAVAVAAGRSTPGAGTPVAPSSSSSQVGSDPEETFLCHRCRHALPSRSMRRCLGRGCGGNYFCAPCSAKRDGPGGGKVRPRAGRRGAETPRDVVGGSSGPDEAGAGCEAQDPWTGPCCEGRCDCWECAAGADKGLLASWLARNGLPSVAGSFRRRRPAGSKPARRLRLPPAPPAAAVAAKAVAAGPTPNKVSVALEWSGWQGRRQDAKAEPVVGRADRGSSTARGNGTAIAITAEAEGHADAAAGRWGEEGADDLGVAETAVGWCRSCSGAAPRDSLARCYYCYGGVHMAGCRRFEEALTLRRLSQYGVGPAGQLTAPPVGEGAVGHGVAVCVRGRWRAGLVLGWNPTLAMHYIRYVDGAEEPGAPSAGLDAIPWDGEWVGLPSRPDGKVEGGVAAAATVGRGEGHSQRSATTVQATGVRWSLVEVALKVCPTPAKIFALADGTTAVVALKPPPPPPESRPAMRVLRGLLKQRFEASQVATGREATTGSSNKYRPPAIALPSSIPDSELRGGRSGSGNANAGGSGSDSDTEIARASEPRTALTRPWVCRSCVEAKLQRLQRRVRSQFQAPRGEPEPAAREIPPPPSSDAAMTPLTPHTEAPIMSGSPLTATADRGISQVAGWLQPQTVAAAAGVAVTDVSCALPVLPVGEGGGSGGGRASEKMNGFVAGCKRPWEEIRGFSSSERAAPGRGAVEELWPRQNGAVLGSDGGTLSALLMAEHEGEAAVVELMATQAEEEAKAKAEAKREAAELEEKRRLKKLRRNRGDRRLRWLPAGDDPKGAHPFGFEAGFLSDLADVHARGGVTASGAKVGAAGTKSTRGRKRARAPAVARAFAHLLGGLETQRPLAFALPPDISRLDVDMGAFFSGRTLAAEGDSGYTGPLESAARDARSIVLVDGTAAVAAAAAGVQRGAEAIGPGASASAVALAVAVPRGGKVHGDGTGALEVGGGGSGGPAAAADAAAALLRVPAAFSVVKEVDLESSARIRPVAGSKHRKLRSSSWGGGVRGASRPHRMCSAEAPTSSQADEGSCANGAGGGGPAGGSTTTLKDVSKKDRLQRMDQRRMRRQGKELVDAGLLNVDVLQSRRKKLRFGRSTVHAWGVFADEPIAAGDLVIEYRGEIIGNAVADKREKQYEDMQIGSDYMFRVDEDTVVDATFKGSLARFINHSCDPSCTTRIIAVEGSKKIVIYAERDVEMGEELSYDYKFPLEADESARVPCCCGSDKCRGFIN